MWRRAQHRPYASNGSERYVIWIVGRLSGTAAALKRGSAPTPLTRGAMLRQRPAGPRRLEVPGQLEMWGAEASIVITRRARANGAPRPAHRYRLTTRGACATARAARWSSRSCRSRPTHRRSRARVAWRAGAAGGWCHCACGRTNGACPRSHQQGGAAGGLLLAHPLLLGPGESATMANCAPGKPRGLEALAAQSQSRTRGGRRQV